jgi:putative transferase (TIGR04331 family)
LDATLSVEAVTAFEDAYVERARRELGDRLGLASAAVLDRLPLSSGELALAGWWCQPDASGLLVLPNPWDDRGAIADHDAYCWALSEVVLDGLVPALSEDRSRVYWDFMLRPWLLLMLAAAMDRRLYCLTLARLRPDIPVSAGAPAPVPATMGAAIGMARTDAGNRALGSVLARRLGLSLEQLPQQEAARSAELPPRSSLAGKGLIALELAADAGLRAALSLRQGRRVVLLRSPGISRLDRIQLWTRVPGLKIVSGMPQPGSSGATDGAARERLASLFNGDERSAILGEAACSLLPRTVLEDYPALVSLSTETYGAPAPLLVGNYGAHDVENEYIARCAEAGKQLAFTQHGGTYLQARVNTQERLECRPDSTFVSWGGSGDGIRALPSPRLERIRDTHRGGERVVILEWIVPPEPYVLRFASTPLGNQGYRQSASLGEFVRAVRTDRDRLFLKRFPAFLEGAARDPEVAALSHRPPANRRTAVRLMAAARLAVIPYPDTALIEAMVIGVPIVAFWDPGMWEVRDDARAPFDALGQAGVLYEDPRDAAAQVDRVYQRADEWWASAEVQAARSAFLQRFAVPGDWLPEWSRLLRELSE